MYASNFQYDNAKLSDYGFIMCLFDDSGGVDVLNIGSTITFNQTPMNHGRSNPLISTQYDDCLTCSFDICKNPDIYDTQEERVISLFEERNLYRWLNRHRFLPLSFVTEVSPIVTYMASFNIEEIRINGVLYGLRLTAITDKPFGYGEQVTKSEVGCKNNFKEISIDFSSDEEGYYPYDSIKIKTKINGDYRIKCRQEDGSWKDTIIKNCTAGEIINIDCKNKIIETNISSHKIYNDFNYVFPALVRGWKKGRNEFTSNAIKIGIDSQSPTTEILDYEIKYTPIVKGYVSDYEDSLNYIDPSEPVSQNLSLVGQIRKDIKFLKEYVGANNVIEKSFSGISTLEINNLNNTFLNVKLSTDNLILLPYDNNFSNTTPNTELTSEQNGLTFRPNSDGSISIWGTATASTTNYNLRVYYMSMTSTKRLKLEKGTYTFGIAESSTLPTGIANGAVRITASGYPSSITVTSSNPSLPICKGNSGTFTLSESLADSIVIGINLVVTSAFSGVTKDNPARIYPMLNKGETLMAYTAPLNKGADISSEPIMSNVQLNVRQDDTFVSDITVTGGATSINTETATKVKLTTSIPFRINIDNVFISQNSSYSTDSRFSLLSSLIGVSPRSISAAKFNNGDTIVLEETMAKKNKNLLFFAKVNTMGTLKIFHGENLYNSGWIQIDSTNLKVYTYDTSTVTRKDVAHGLTIQDYIGVIAITGNNNNLSVRLITNGGEFTVENVWWGSSNGVIKAVSDGCSFTSVGMSWNCDDYKKKLWLYGDSYFDFYNTARWTYYLIKWGFDNCAAFGFPGAKSADVYPEWKRTLDHGTPKYAVWCLGMNDVDSSSAINESWKYYVNQFISDCKSKGIEPILATIPNTPNRRHTYKNEFVKNSGLRYIDFADAVNASSYPSSWFDGMLSTDNTHPLKEGAITLAIRAITDLPELAQV